MRALGNVPVKKLAIHCKASHTGNVNLYAMADCPNL